jgi:hypothetical protein
METLWGVLLSCLFVLATLSGYYDAGPSRDKSEQKEKSDQADKGSSKDNSEQADESSSKDSSQQANKSSSAKVSKRKSNICIKNCPDAGQLCH